MNIYAEQYERTTEPIEKAELEIALKRFFSEEDFIRHILNREDFHAFQDVIDDLFPRRWRWDFNV